MPKVRFRGEGEGGHTWQTKGASQARGEPLRKALRYGSRMMRVNLKILGLPTLSKVTGKKELDVNFEGKTVNDLIGYIVKRYGPKAGEAILDEDGQLDITIQVLLNGRDWITRDRFDTVLKDGDSVALMLMVAGG
ncbi:MAG: MoaD family protein [Anaerolineales bacterium]|nr:MAG: MoaD family protein [Anaerolineales bacterium]